MTVHLKLFHKNKLQDFFSSQNFVNDYSKINFTLKTYRQDLFFVVQIIESNSSNNNFPS